MSLQDDLMTAWKAAKPVTQESALAIAGTVLSVHPKELSDFRKWFDRNGGEVVRKVNDGI